MKSCAVAVIGHVDHGKTTLVGALTGIETDRLKEEKERGLSITLGFAHREYSSGIIDFIDAPGHEDFIRAMVSGATGARAVLLVVSAVDGIEQQSREHLQIATMLGIKTGIVVITKSDLLPESERQLQHDRIAAELAGTSLAGQPILFCSAKSGEGLESLNHAIATLIDRVAPEPELAGFFLPVDRVFTVQGMGTVVTGTLLGKILDAGGDAVMQPLGQRVTVRRLQTHGADSGEVQPGGRTAVNLRGISVKEIKRGDVLCAPDVFSVSQQIDAYITVSPQSARPLKHVDDLRVMFGTSNEITNVRLLDSRQLEPGESGFAQLRFTAPIAAFAGQRAVLRRLSPQETMGGIVILDPVAQLSTAKESRRLAILEAARAGDIEQIAAALAAGDAGIAVIAEIARLARRTAASVRSVLLEAAFDDIGKDTLAPHSMIASVKTAYLDQLRTFHKENAAKLTAPVPLIREALDERLSSDLIAHVEEKLVASGMISLRGDEVALSEHDPFSALSEQQQAQLKAMECSLSESMLTPPDLPDLLGTNESNTAILDLLVRSGRAISLYNADIKKTLVFHAGALEKGLALLKAAYPPPAEFKIGDARAALSTTRKFVMPVLEYFDAQGFTVREGDYRRIVVAS